MQWVPFYSYIADSVNLWMIITIFEKVFLYGSLVWLFEEFTTRWIYSAIFAPLSILTIEILQIFVKDRTPEITDPIIVLLMAFWIKQFRQTKDTLPRARDENVWSSETREYLIRR